MDIPLAVNAGSLNVIIPASERDLIVLIVNVVAVLIAGFGGVYAGHKLAQKERVTARASEELAELHLGMLYVQGMLSAQYNSLNMVLGTFNKNAELLIAQRPIATITSITEIHFDYRMTINLLPAMPNIVVKVSSILEGVHSLNAGIDFFNSRLEEIVTLDTHQNEEQVNIERYKELSITFINLLSQALNLIEYIEKDVNEVFVDGKNVLLSKLGLELTSELPVNYKLLGLKSTAQILQRQEEGKLSLEQLQRLLDELY